MVVSTQSLRFCQPHNGFRLSRRTLPPQHMPKEAHFVIVPPVSSVISFTTAGILLAVFGGAAGPWKKAPSFSPFSLVSGGYQEWSAGLPKKKSGTKT